MSKDSEKNRVVCEPTLRRLPVYHRLLKELQAEGWSFASCTDIGEKLVLDPMQVRKDLEVTGVVGKPKVGYVVPALIDGIDQYAGSNLMRGQTLTWCTLR